MNPLPDQPKALARLDSLFSQALALGEKAEAWLDTLPEQDAGFAPTLRSLLEASRDEDSAFDTISTTRASFLDSLLKRRAEPLDAGARVGPFIVLDAVGRGGFAQVYKAKRDTDLFEQIVALKVFDAPVSQDKEAQRFADECSALARIEHPNIARIIDGGGEPSGQAWIAIEYVDGQPITQALRRASESERLDAALQVAAAVADAHRQGVLHLDIKPSNILFDHESRVRVLDFGLAQLTEPAQSELSSTGEISALTPAYAAPEQLDGQALGVVTDVYMIGGLLAELLTGERPGADMARALVNLPRPLQQIITTCRAHDPDDRYASVDRLISDIERYHERLPISLSQTPNRDLAVAAVRRNPWVAGLSLVVAATVAGWALTSTYLSELYQQERDRAIAQESTAQATTAAVLSVFRRADPLVLDTALEPDANAWQYLAAAAEDLRETLEDEPAALIEILSLAEVLHRRADQADEAAGLRNELLGMISDLYGPDSLEAIMAQIDVLGPQATANSGVGPAELSAIENRLQAFAESAPERVAYGYLVLAYARRGLGDEAEAERLALLALETVPDTRPEYANTSIEALLVLGQIANWGGRPQDAIERLNEAVGLTQTIYGQEHARLVGPLSSLAAAKRAMGDYESGIAHLVRAIAIQTRYEGSNSETVLALRNNLAISYSAAGLYALAEAEQRELLTFDLARTDQGSALATRYQNLARTLEAQGAFADAREAYETAVELFADALSPQNATRWVPYISLARVQLKDGDIDAARVAVDAARGGLEPILPADHFALDMLTCFDGAIRMNGPDPLDSNVLRAAADRLEPLARRAEERGFCLAALGGR
ncbi:MAG: serine/threonine-protein kinase [Pseudomonadota bacterium]